MVRGSIQGLGSKDLNSADWQVGWQEETSLHRLPQQI